MFYHFLFFMYDIEPRSASAIRECELFLQRGSYREWNGFKFYWVLDFADESRFRDTRRVMNGWNQFHSLGLRKSNRRTIYIPILVH